ncbi:hypothetical protein E3J79_02955 [Candidatus Dependentiae bacterium]|nr:MAG: hypothetical protein E3J79_02955 [Candidatus Dependentiae bacterium]
MKRLLKIQLSYIVACVIVCISIVLDVHSVDKPAVQEDAVKDNQKISNAAISEKIISFHYDNEDLVDVINSLASLKEVNVVLPEGPNAITSKLTFHIAEKVTLEQAWDLLYTILDVAGYSMAERVHNTFVIRRTNKEVTKEALPIYIGVAPDDLPDTDKRIRYLYFLSNIKVSEEAEDELQSLLKDLLPAETSSYRIEPASNGLIITAKANEIRSVMRIVKLLEQTTYKEKMEPVKLYHVSVSTVANLFNESILKTPERHRYGVDTKKPSEITYFSKYVKVIPYDYTNTLIVVGREQAVERIRDFVRKYIDVPLDAGKSILHIYQLQYLDAVEFEPVIQKIVEAAAPGPRQAEAEAGKQVGVERYFEGVIIRADKPEEVAEGKPIKGTNKLIIAARNDDWIIIKRLIEQLDMPQPQVIIQVLVADLDLTDVRLIGSILRNSDKLHLPKGVAFQAANIADVFVDNVDKPTTLAADLLRNYYSDQKGKVIETESGTYSYADQASVANSTFVSLSDCGKCWTWALLRFLHTLGYRKVLSLPHVIAVNNKKAEIKIGDERFVPDAGVGGAGGTVTATKKWIKADLKIDLTPRIAYGEKEQALTLDIVVDIDDFKTTSKSDADHVTRHFETTAILNSGDVLALGGLMRLEDANNLNETPVLAQIPILGYLFKRRERKTPKTNLTVFIMPTVIQPKLRGGMGIYTQDYIQLTKRYTQEGELFDSLKDPITRWFFKPENMVEESINDFVSKEELNNKTARAETTSDRKKDEIEKSTGVTSRKAGKKDKIAMAKRRKRNVLRDEHEDKLTALLAGQSNPLAEG